jgi:hypothetical protein
MSLYGTDPSNKQQSSQARSAVVSSTGGHRTKKPSGPFHVGEYAQLQPAGVVLQPVAFLSRICSMMLPYKHDKHGGARLLTKK